MEKKWRKTVQAAFLQCFYNRALKYVKQLQVLGYIALVKHHITKSIKNNWCLYEYGKRLQFIIGHWPIAPLVLYDDIFTTNKHAYFRDSSGNRCDHWPGIWSHLIRFWRVFLPIKILWVSLCKCSLKFKKKS